VGAPEELICKTCPSVEEVNELKAPVVEDESEMITPFTANEDAPVPPLAMPNVPETTALVSILTAVFETPETLPYASVVMTGR
jgi:hypothetical protein